MAEVRELDDPLIAAQVRPDVSDRILPQETTHLPLSAGSQNSLDVNLLDMAVLRPQRLRDRQALRRAGRGGGREGRRESRHVQRGTWLLALARDE